MHIIFNIILKNLQFTIAIVWGLKTSRTRVPQNTYPVPSKPVLSVQTVPVYNIVCLHCSCMLLFCIHWHCIAALHVDKTWLTIIQFPEPFSCNASKFLYLNKSPSIVPLFDGYTQLASSIDYPDGRFSSGETSNSHFFGHIDTGTHYTNHACNATKCITLLSPCCHLADATKCITLLAGKVYSLLDCMYRPSPLGQNF